MERVRKEREKSDVKFDSGAAKAEAVLKASQKALESIRKQPNQEAQTEAQTQGVQVIKDIIRTPVKQKHDLTDYEIYATKRADSRKKQTKRVASEMEENTNQHQPERKKLRRKPTKRGLENDEHQKKGQKVKVSYQDW